MASLLPASQAPSQRQPSPGTERNEFFVPVKAGPHRRRKKFILCFDGTGNKFSGTDSDSNILKIYRMLDRNDESQFHYYQPGIGTYVVSKSYSHTSRIDRLKSWYAKAKDSAVGTSFDEHVMAGYRFLMRYYIPGDDIYFFGFSRGAYTARFLAEMLDHIGLLSAGNEEMCHFAWKTFQKWQVRQERTEKEKDDKKYLLDFMCAFRETFSRPVRRIRFLGLFDTVNSVPRFENAWMQRSKFPYTARSSAKVVRHAVAIDERRAKFRQDLISETKPKKTHHYHHRRQRVLHPFNLAAIDEVEQQTRGRPSTDTHRYNPSRRGTLMPPENEIFKDGSDTRGIRSLSPGLSPNGRSENDRPSSAATSISETSMAAIIHHDDEDSDGEEQDIREVWFAGCHADIGGGWPLGDGEDSALSHIPLVWMVKEAQSAGLHFDEVKLKALNCCPDDILRSKSTVVPQIEIDPASPDPEIGPSSGLQHRLRPHTTTSCVGSKPSRFHTLLESAACHGKIHDVLQFGNGVSRASVVSWNIMEYLPFRRMDLQEDGSWKSIAWPLPKGETRDVPDNVVIHNSVVKRMETNPDYRPGNLIVGGGGRGVRKAPAQYGMGKWIVDRGEGDPVSEVLVRAAPPEKKRSENGVTNMGHTPFGPQGVWISANR
ncbi:uncharacterized protein BDZ99DRAFT_570756 [Mytilinidion resinicola]|uniref:T6SS Phospholipase effector Tle1-like catalytic domain-containing protein n=1 Tax=Mytilinidion resinicola TaxID=574789 RepID=A0A6A6YQ68_9PEZI|nr:uncharacterized protein BDZ99DRAFT_570756 [Mytilinidion resinicola]KAF2810135.1 hypothetical protein BDZ99DRAFT_570756 [Mytilinidion resinicola]